MKQILHEEINLFLRVKTICKTKEKRLNITKHYFIILEESFNASDKSPLDKSSTIILP